MAGIHRPTIELLWHAHKPSFFRSDNVSAAGAYTAMAMADPKAPVELQLMGPAVWSFQVAAVTTAMYVVDPLGLRPGEGLDESYHMWSDVRERVDRIKDPVDDFFSAPPSFWDTWYIFD